MNSTFQSPPIKSPSFGGIFCFLLLLIAGALSQPAHSELENYRLAADDTISVTVYNEPDLSLQKNKVATNGTIAVPLLGQISVSGLSIAEVEAKLSKLFADGYLKKPALTVTVNEYRPFYINGEVKKPGSYSYRDGLTVHRAVTLAGGFSERAAKRAITLSHEGYPEDQTNLRVKLTDLIQPGDVITVGESFF